MNLFFVHTPFQLIVAQSICEQNNLSNNVLILSFTGVSGQKFYDVYDRLIINAFWKDILRIGNINVFSTVWSMIKKLPILLKKVDTIIRNNKVDSLFLGDINHPFYASITVRYTSKINISYFEEGLSHYAIQYPEFESSIINTFKHKLLDLILFKKLGLSGFDQYLYNRKKYNLERRINAIYSIISSRSRPGDKLIKLKMTTPDSLIQNFKELNQIIENNKPSKAILYLSTTANDLFNNSLDKADFLLMGISRLNIERGVVFIKFHPKEDPKVGENILEKLRVNNHIGIIISSKFPYPVELLFGNLNFDVITAFDSSSLLYANALNICNAVYSLTPLIIEYNEANNIDSSYPKSINERFNKAYIDLFGTNIGKI